MSENTVAAVAVPANTGLMFLAQRVVLSAAGPIRPIFVYLDSSWPSRVDSRRTVARTWFWTWLRNAGLPVESYPGGGGVSIANVHDAPGTYEVHTHARAWVESWRHSARPVSFSHHFLLAALKSRYCYWVTTIISATDGGRQCFDPLFVCLSVCLSVNKITKKL